MLGRLESESGAIWCLYVGVKTTTFNKKKCEQENHGRRKNKIY